MRRITNCCTLASVSVLVMLTLFPVMGWGKPDFYGTPTESESRCCVVQDIALKRFDELDHDSFVSLMGRRSAPKPTRIIDRLLAGLLERTSTGKVRRGLIMTHEQPRLLSMIKLHPALEDIV